MAKLPGRTFPEQIKAFRDKAVARLNTATAEIMEETGRRVIARTPVDTGFLASNWNYSLGEPDTSVSEAPQDRTLHGLSAMPAQAAGQRHFISNGVTYAVYVEHGTSRMAPRAMVALTVVEFSDIAAHATAVAQQKHR